MATQKFDFRIRTDGAEFTLQVWHRGLTIGRDEEIAARLTQLINENSKTPRKIFGIPDDGRNYAAYGEGLYSVETDTVSIQNCIAEEIGNG